MSNFSDATLNNFDKNAPRGSGSEQGLEIKASTSWFWVMNVDLSLVISDYDESDHLWRRQHFLCERTKE